MSCSAVWEAGWGDDALTAISAAVFFWCDMVFGKEQFIKMRLICKVQHGDDLRDRIVRFHQIVFRFAQGESRAVFKQSHSSVFLGDPVQIVAAVAEGVCQFMTAKSSVAALKQMRQPREDQEIIAVIDPHFGQVKMLCV